MGAYDAYENVRNDVASQYNAALENAKTSRYQEGLGGPLSVPTIKVSGSQPAWLCSGWRKALAVIALVALIAGLVIMTTMSSESLVTAGFSGAFAIVALIVAYLTVAGFGTVTFSIGSGADSNDDEVERQG